MPRTTQVMLIEDHTEYRDVIELALETISDIELIGTFGAAEIALRGLGMGRREAPPDVILLDLNLPGMPGLDAIPALLSRSPNSKIIVLTESDQEAHVLRSIALGAVGYLLKSAAVGKIVDGIRSAVAGDAPLDAAVAKYILNTLKTALPKQRVQQESRLTSREIQILQLLSDGLTKKEIASQLRVSNSTVSTHAVHIFDKLSVRNAPAAVAKAFRLGLIPSG